ncbi:MAG TPA: ABC transporter ATP-binding protein [Micromonosporaceae bacterium]
MAEPGWARPDVSEPAISIEGVSRRYPGSTRPPALDDVHLAVGPGEFVCVVGRSGCGKSTLLDLVAGHQAPNSGRVSVHGGQVHGPGPDRVVVFQDHTLFPWLTVRENVEFGLRAAGLSRARRRSAAEDWLDRVHLYGYADARPHELSGGQRQRVALARALALRPAVLLMDEPFSAVDAQTREHLQVELQQLWAQTGTTVLFVTHDVREAVVLADRVVVLAPAPGRVVGVVPVDLPRPRTVEDDGVLDLARQVRALMDRTPPRTAVGALPDGGSAGTGRSRRARAA